MPAGDFGAGWHDMECNAASLATAGPEGSTSREML